MDYIELIERVINYIELHLEDEIKLEKIASQENFSSYYFHRIFSAIVGESLASYISDRRLNASLNLIKNSQHTLTEIAFIYRFSSQSSFIRSFKNKYNVTPSKVRKGTHIINEVDAHSIVKRSIINFNSDLVTKFKLIDFEEIVLYGVYMDFDLSQVNYVDKIRYTTQEFFTDHKDLSMKQAFQVIFDCKSSQNQLRIFLGFVIDSNTGLKEMQTLILPSMLVAEFKYEGELLNVGNVIGKDLTRWSKLAKKDLHKLGISAIHEININNIDQMFKIIIPIEERKNIDN